MKAPSLVRVPVGVILGLHFINIASDSQRLKEQIEYIVVQVIETHGAETSSKWN